MRAMNLGRATEGMLGSMLLQLLLIVVPVIKGQLQVPLMQAQLYENCQTARIVYQMDGCFQNPEASQGVCEEREEQSRAYAYKNWNKMIMEERTKVMPEKLINGNPFAYNPNDNGPKPGEQGRDSPFPIPETPFGDGQERELPLRRSIIQRDSEETESRLDSSRETSKEKKKKKNRGRGRGGRRGRGQSGRQPTEITTTSRWFQTSRPTSYRKSTWRPTNIGRTTYPPVRSRGKPSRQEPVTQSPQPTQPPTNSPQQSHTNSSKHLPPFLNEAPRNEGNDVPPLGGGDPYSFDPLDDKFGRPKWDDWQGENIQRDPAPDSRFQKLQIEATGLDCKVERRPVHRYFEYQGMDLCCRGDVNVCYGHCESWSWVFGEAQTLDRKFSGCMDMRLKKRWVFFHCNNGCYFWEQVLEPQECQCRTIKAN